MSGITAILTHWRRWETLPLQVAALERSTVRPDEIIVLGNEASENEPKIPGCQYIMSDINTRYHGRFAVALLAQTPLVALFDDDTVPGAKWLENCLETRQMFPHAILGTSGVRLLGDTYTGPDNERVGWNGAHSVLAELVDLVGHAWMVDAEALADLWSEPPRTLETGEDIALSCLAWIRHRTQTIVPPHPRECPEMWGSDPEIGKRYGTDSNCSAMHTNRRTRDLLLRYYVLTGYVPVRMR